MRPLRPDRELTTAVLYPAAVLPSGLGTIGESVAGTPGKWIGFGLGGLLGLPVLVCCLVVLVLIALMQRAR